MNGRALAAETTFHWSVRLNWSVVVAEFACALHRGRVVADADFRSDQVLLPPALASNVRNGAPSFRPRVSQPPADALVHGLKYGGWSGLAPFMGERMAQSAIVREFGA